MAKDLKSWFYRGRTINVPHPAGLAAASVSFNGTTGEATSVDDDVADAILAAYQREVEDITE